MLIDGAHRFPMPIVDWFYTAPHIKEGGWLLVDDAFLGSVNVLVSFLRSHPSWSLEDVFGGRTACFVKLAQMEEMYDWIDSPFDSRWNSTTSHRRLGPWRRRACVFFGSLRCKHLFGAERSGEGGSP